MAKEITLDDLARMINNMDQRLGKDINEVKTEMRAGFRDHTERLDRIEDRLNNFAYNFDVKTLDKRVTKIENLLKTKGLPGFAKNH